MTRFFVFDLHIYNEAFTLLARNKEAPEYGKNYSNLNYKLKKRNTCNETSGSHYPHLFLSLILKKEHKKQPR